MIEVKGKGGISAKIVADSVSEAGKRITTYELEYPRFIHGEFMTHRLFSRNAASSRAIPVKKMIEHVEQNTAMPIHWGKNQPGMQANEECKSLIGECSREQLWRNAAWCATDIADSYAVAGYHKQIVNRILEPYQFIKVVCTATEFDNFFWLRKHPDAQPEIAELAKCMWESREQSEPMLLKAGEWHVPYYQGNYGDGVWKYSGYAKEVGIGDFEETDHKRGHTLSEALKISSSCCAQVSYRLTDNSLDKAEKIYDMLVNSKPVHASPFEHQAQPMPENTGGLPVFDVQVDGIARQDMSGNYWSANFKGWIQHRQMIPENACWNYSE